MSKHMTIETVSRADIEDFLATEADLLDRWQLDDWLQMLASDAIYEVPSLDFPEKSASDSIYLIADDRTRLESRCKQLDSPIAWVESPHSRTRRLITGVRIVGRTADQLDMTANYAVWRFKNAATDIYVGQYRHRFIVEDGHLRIKVRRAILDLEALRPHGKLSFIL